LKAIWNIREDLGGYFTVPPLRFLNTSDGDQFG
jgi:hypothetical protein